MHVPLIFFLDLVMKSIEKAFTAALLSVVLTVGFCCGPSEL